MMRARHELSFVAAILAVGVASGPLLAQESRRLTESLRVEAGQSIARYVAPYEGFEDFDEQLDLRVIDSSVARATLEGSTLIVEGVRPGRTGVLVLSNLVNRHPERGGSPRASCLREFQVEVVEPSADAEGLLDAAPFAPRREGDPEVATQHRTMRVGVGLALLALPAVPGQTIMVNSADSRIAVARLSEAGASIHGLARGTTQVTIQGRTADGREFRIICDVTVGRREEDDKGTKEPAWVGWPSEPPNVGQGRVDEGCEVQPVFVERPDAHGSESHQGRRESFFGFGFGGLSFGASRDFDTRRGRR